MKWSSVWSNIERVYMLWKLILCVLVTLQFKNNKNTLFLLTIYIRLCWQNFHNHQDKKYIFGKKKKLYSSYVSICLSIHEKSTNQSSLCWCLEPNLVHDSLCIFMKSMKISSKSSSLPSISQLGVDFERWN